MGNQTDWIERSQNVVFNNGWLSPGPPSLFIRLRFLEARENIDLNHV